MIGECKECGELYGGLGLTTKEVCPNCTSLVEMTDPGEELRPFVIRVLNCETLEVELEYETWQYTADENLRKDHKYPLVTLQFPVDQ